MCLAFHFRKLPRNNLTVEQSATGWELEKYLTTPSLIQTGNPKMNWKKLNRFLLLDSEDSVNTTRLTFHWLFQHCVIMKYLNVSPIQMNSGCQAPTNSRKWDLGSASETKRDGHPEDSPNLSLQSDSFEKLWHGRLSLANADILRWIPTMHLYLLLWMDTE